MEEPASANNEAQQPQGLATDDPPISRRQQKRKAKMERIAEIKKKRKLDKKESKRQAQAVKKAKVQETLASMTPEEKAARRKETQARLEQKRAEKAAQHERAVKGLESGVKLVVDLDFFDRMTEREHKSLVQQLAYSVSANSHAAVPGSLQMTSCAGAMKELLTQQSPGHVNWVAGIHEAPFHEVFRADLERMVYLTADSDHELATLEGDHLYVIGGIVDRNRYKRLCLDRAKELGVKTARLPIGEHLKLAGSKVLTVNQVVALLVKFIETHDWKAACETVVPPRKTADTEGEAKSKDGDEGQARGSDAHDGADEKAGELPVPADAGVGAPGNASIEGADQSIQGKGGDEQVDDANAEKREGEDVNGEAVGSDVLAAATS